MITISEIKKAETAQSSRIDAVINIKDEKGSRNFTLYIETDNDYGKYFVTDRCDAFVVGILLYAMVHGHDITCIQPVSAELKFLLESQLILTLCKNDASYYQTKIIADETNVPLTNAGAVGTGISLGLDSFCTIADHYQHPANQLKLTHLLTVQNGILGGYYRNNNQDYCASKLLEREKEVAAQLGLPLITVNTNLMHLMRMRADFYVSYWLGMIVMSLGHLFATYLVSSIGVGYGCFNVKERMNADCEYYDLLSMSVFSQQNGVRFISAGGAYDRLDKFRIISKFPPAVSHLQSCLTSHFNCMSCMKCRRNLVTMDALGILDNFKEVYDIPYYRNHRDEYMEWMCTQVNQNGHDADYVRDSYMILKEREPEYIKQFELSPAQFVAKYAEMKKQRDVFLIYARMYRRFISVPDAVSKLKNWLQEKNICNVIIYGSGSNSGTQLLVSLSRQLGIKILYIVENTRKKTNIPRLPEDTIVYPDCDAVIICNMSSPDFIKRKLSEFVTVPVYDMKEILSMKL